MTSSSRAKRPTTAWRADPRSGLGLAGAALLSLLWLPGAAFAAEESADACVRVVHHDAAVEGGGLRVRGEVTNGCAYVARYVRVQVEAREFSYTLSRQTIRAGSVIIELRNAGEDAHDLRMRRVGGTRTYTWPVTQSQGVVDEEFRLLPGRYVLWCSLPGHRARGMQATLVVRKP